MNISGLVSFEERLDALDKQLFLIARNDIRSIVADYSRFRPLNPVTDGIYFSEVMARHAGQMNQAENVLILPGLPPGAERGLLIMRDAGIGLSAYVARKA